MGFSLYEINSQIEAALTSAVDQETGEIISEKALEALQVLEMQKDEKVEQLALLYKNKVAEAAALKAEKMAFTARQTAAEKAAESIKQYLSQALNGEKFKTDRCSIGWRRSESVTIAEGAFLPDEYLTFKAPEPNKMAIKNALKAGKKIEGASLDTANNIQIK